MTILNDKQIRQKVKRLAYEIIEQHTGVKKLFLAGINNNGYAFAHILLEEIKAIDIVKPEFELFRLTLNPAAPTEGPAELHIEPARLKNKHVIIVDDVANTGRTLFYAFRPLMPLLLKKLQVAVLVDRKHKSFPIHVDFLGLSLATTLNDHIDVHLDSHEAWSVEII